MNVLPKPMKKEVFICINCANGNLDPITFEHVHCNECGQNMNVNKKEFDIIYEFWLLRKLRNKEILKNLIK